MSVPETREKGERLIAVWIRDQGTWRPITVAGTRDLTNSPYLHVPISSFTVFTRYHKPGGTFIHCIEQTEIGELVLLFVPIYQFIHCKVAETMVAESIDTDFIWWIFEFGHRTQDTRAHN